MKFEAGVTVAQLNETLPSHGMALSKWGKNANIHTRSILVILHFEYFSQGSIGDITVAGAIATATHGTGVAFGTICSHVN